MRKAVFSCLGAGFFLFLVRMSFAADLGICTLGFDNCMYKNYQEDMWETLKKEPCLSSLVYNTNRLRTAELVYLLHRVQIDQPPLSAFCNAKKTKPVSLKKIKNMMSEYTRVDEVADMTHEDVEGCTGVVISYDERVDAVVVRGLLARSPAYESGIRRDDSIRSVDGVAVGDDTGRARKFLKGVPGSYTQVQVQRNGVLLGMRVLREECDDRQMEWSLCHDIGYLHMLEFGNNIIGDNLKNALILFYAYDVAGVVIDLRGNAGGLVNVATALAGVFLPEGTVVYSQRSPYISNDDTEMKTAIETDLAYWFREKPLIVLVDRMTVSASEIFVGALRTHHRAVIVGDRTYGKGVGTIPVYLSDDAKLTVTSFLWNLPTGENINHIGIQPHVDRRDAETLASDEVLSSCLYPEDRTLRYAVETILYQTNYNGHQ